MEGHIEVLLAEYQRIQEDIRHHKSTQQVVLNYILLVLAAEVAALLQLQPRTTRPAELLLLFPVPLALLAMYRSAYTSRVHLLTRYADETLRPKINSSLGADVLGTYGWVPTKHLWHLRQSQADGRQAYLALSGLILLPQLVPIVTYLAVHPGDWKWWQVVFALATGGLAIWSSVGQHD